MQIRVQDNGSGIHLEDLPYIFKHFCESRLSQDTQGAGTAPCWRICQMAVSETINELWQADTRNKPEPAGMK